MEGGAGVTRGVGLMRGVVVEGRACVSIVHDDVVRGVVTTPTLSQALTIKLSESDCCAAWVMGCHTNLESTEEIKCMCVCVCV